MFSSHAELRKAPQKTGEKLQDPHSSISYLQNQERPENDVIPSKEMTKSW